MQRAGQAASDLADQLLTKKPARVLVLAGPGNNGGDALVVARLLADSGHSVTVMLCIDPARHPADAQEALKRAKASSISFVPGPEINLLHAEPWDLIVDGLFGIGLARPISGAMRTLVEEANTLSCPLLALDIPSGLDADTGNIVGPDGMAIRASHTITFIGDKPGLHTAFGRDYAGEIHVSDLCIDRSHFAPARLHLNGIEAFVRVLKKRPHNSHKGSFGDVIIVGGASGMSGASILSARAAAHCGAGRVYAAFLDQPPPYDSMHPELMCRSVDNIEFASATLVAGPGLGTSSAARQALEKVLHTPNALVLDADALNLIAGAPALQQLLAHRPAKAVLTPHPLEAARLLQTSTADIQGNRVSAACRLSKMFDAVIVLKGSGSILARSDGFAMINPTGNPALATAGTGDVLAGICGALLAQSIPPWETALASVWIHGAAADELVRQGTGPIGLTASELIPSARTILNRLTRQYAK